MFVTPGNMLEALIASGIALVAAGAAAGASWFVGRSAARDVFGDLVHAVEVETMRTAGLREEAREFFDRAEAARARARSAQQSAERVQKRNSQSAEGDAAVSSDPLAAAEAAARDAGLM